MADTNSQKSHSNIERLSASLLTRTPCSCGLLQPNGSTPTPKYDIWIRPRPNTEWQNTENQAFVDYTQFDNVSLDDEDDDASDDEEGQTDSSDELSDAEESDNESEGEDCEEEDDTAGKHNAACNSLDCPGLPDEDVLGTDHVSACQLPASVHQESRIGRPETVHCGSAGLEDISVKRFLGVMEDHDMYRDSINRLRQFFKTATMGELEGGAGETKESRILLEDRNYSTKSFRRYPRSMTPKKLYSALRKQRYPATSSSKPATAAPKSWTKSEDCQVETRKLHVSNLNEWSALVLAATASPTQAPVLFDFIDQYLKFETSISVDPNPYLSRMTLCFQLPFYTFRARQYTDSRQDHEGNPLRKSFELPCMQLPGMSRKSSKSWGWICESQVSVLVSVIDADGWTAYAFEDTYYKTRESLRELDIFCSKPGLYFPDAFTAGNLDSTCSLEPREYFLRVLQVRIDQAYREWQGVVDNVEEVVKSPINRIYSNRDERILLQQRYSNWISDMIAIISDQSGQLSKTLTAWDEFEKRCPKYFPEKARSLLETSIGHTFSKIRILKDKLDSLSKEICNDQSTLSAHLAVENTGTAKFVRVLNVICFLMMPMALNIALFSTQPGVLPFQMTFIAFVTSFFVLALLVCMVWVILSQWDALVVLICYTLKSLDSAFQGPSVAETKSEYREDQTSETRATSTGVDGRSSRMDAAPSRPRRTIWRHLNIHLPVRRGQAVAPVESHELADLGTVVYV